MSLEEIIYEFEIAKGQRKLELSEEIAFLSRNIYVKNKIEKPEYLLANIIKEKAYKINEEIILSLSQTKIYNSMIENNDILISASTSFGKTWLCSLVFKELISKNNSEGFIFIHIVPENILVLQGISEVNKTLKNLENEDINVSDAFTNNKFQYIFGTPESIFNQYDFLINNINKIKTIIFDEAHEMMETTSRGEFYKFLFKSIQKESDEHATLINFWILSAFINDIKNFKKEILNKNNIKGINVFLPEGFKSTYIINDFFNKKTYFPNKESKLLSLKKKGLKLFFYSTQISARENFSKIKISLKNIEEGIKNIYLKNGKSFKDYKSILERYKISSNNYEYQYDVLAKLSLGYALYHSGVPHKIRNLIFELASNGFIKEIHTTSSILGGVNLPIEEINIIDTKINQIPFDGHDFYNLAGRAGRFNKDKEPILGQVNIKLTAENNIWINKNKKVLKNRVIYKKINKNQRNISFVNESLKKSLEDKNKSEWYIIDPRINPIVIDNILNDKETFYSTFKKFVLFLFKVLKKGKITYMENEENDIWEDGEEAVIIFKEIFAIYINNDLKGEYKNDESLTLKNTEKVKAIRLLFQSLWYFNEDLMHERYHNWAISMRKDNNSWFFKNNINVSKHFENRIKLFNQQTKYKLSMIISHMFKIAKKLQLTNFDWFDLTYMHTFSSKFSKYIIENKYEETWFKMINKNGRVIYNFDEIINKNITTNDEKIKEILKYINNFYKNEMKINWDL